MKRKIFLFISKRPSRVLKDRRKQYNSSFQGKARKDGGLFSLTILSLIKETSLVQRLVIFRQFEQDKEKKEEA